MEEDLGGSPLQLSRGVCVHGGCHCGCRRTDIMGVVGSHVSCGGLLEQ